MTKLTFLLAILLILSSASEGKEKRGKGKGREKEHAVRVAPSRVFRSPDRTVIVDYYRRQPGGLPPGLAKRRDLPPGLEKQLRRDGALPPGLERHFTPFPQELEMRLPPCPEGVRRGFVGGVAVMWDTRRGLVLDAVAMFGR